ncbi:hypothetical protein BS47DRAFT_1369035 [Hydnum rufescens UP504]|uniref:Uncharacterized protein n=1 Tax=Hydnum rufescens UP504 TaxID=1448309 RepID=A0A9P6DMC0_9AGAM|nr:hypothetical protein BS47DRAFT_1369035 [Hydnum rufescens UP504]
MSKAEDELRLLSANDKQRIAKEKHMLTVVKAMLKAILVSWKDAVKFLKKTEEAKAEQAQWCTFSSSQFRHEESKGEGNSEDHPVVNVHADFDVYCQQLLFITKSVKPFTLSSYKSLRWIPVQFLRLFRDKYDLATNNLSRVTSETNSGSSIAPTVNASSTGIESTSGIFTILIEVEHTTVQWLIIEAPQSIFCVLGQWSWMTTCALKLEQYPAAQDTICTICVAWLIGTMGITKQHAVAVEDFCTILASLGLGHTASYFNLCGILIIGCPKGPS